MRFMNEIDIDVAVRRWSKHPVLGPAARTLENLKNAANANSDGWAYWPKPTRAAAKLMELIEGDGTVKYLHGDREDATPAKLKAALSPVKAFRTRSKIDFEIVEAL
jgi:hypothetical protein